MMFNSSIVSSDALQQKTVMTSIEGRHGICLIWYPSSSSTSLEVHHVLRSFQHIINDDEQLTNIFPMSLLRIKLPMLQDNTDHNTIQPCHDNLCKTCQIIDMDTTIT
eukprot:g21289.t1